MSRQTKFVNNEIYHVYNRGADKRMIFLNDHDRLRFLHGLFVFNDVNSANVNLTDWFHRHTRDIMDDMRIQHGNHHIPREPMVEILAFALMPNHFHLLLRQHVEGGITRFMHKLGTGYTLYFNQKTDRAGCLFQGKFKAVRIETDEHLLHIPYYIHANPLNLRKDNQAPEKFLRMYRWSSHMDYCGWNNFPSITQRDFLLEMFDGEENYRRSLSQWVKDKERNSKRIACITMEAVAVFLLSVGCFLQSVCDTLAYTI